MYLESFSLSLLCRHFVDNVVNGYGDGYGNGYGDGSSTSLSEDDSYIYIIDTGDTSGYVEAYYFYDGQGQGQGQGYGERADSTF